ncbi:hypothetical protein EVAR_66725_1 [Eumeta japonica]|uniref:Secreted protein n=1 Tax=Eumeta variegata TaxID=151549 RepID=A0A4C2A3U4_EUMVA|nr:hypothetical protein EVAR_66725_1 [Eumeta japonica]
MRACVFVCVCVCVRTRVCARLFVCVCVRERESERERPQFPVSEKLLRKDVVNPHKYNVAGRAAGFAFGRRGRAASGRIGSKAPAQKVSGVRDGRARLGQWKTETAPKRNRSARHEPVCMPISLSSLALSLSLLGGLTVLEWKGRVPSLLCLSLALRRANHARVEGTRASHSLSL